MPGSYNRVKLRIPSLQPPFTFNKDASSQDVQKQYQELLQLGLNALNQPETLLDRTMTRAERIAYKPELNLLDTLLTEVYQFTTTEGEVVFSIKPRIYKQLRERLKKAEDNIFKHNPSLDPNELPHLPAWGPYNRDLQYWNPVDFEIVGVNYRLQVENFLIALADKLYSEGNDHNTKDKAPVPDINTEGFEGDGVDEPASMGDIKLAKRAVPRRARNVHEVANEIQQPQLPDRVCQYIHNYSSNHIAQSLQEIDLNDCPDVSGLRIHTYPSARAVFFAPSDISGVEGMRAERIRAVGRWQGHQPWYNCVFIGTDSEEPGFRRYLVTRVFLFFAFSWGNTRHPCALVQWFSTLT
ncbi:hypothetical protein H1R20_g14809, partial [Candolleomyces eurysporus]